MKTTLAGIAAWALIIVICFAWPQPAQPDPYAQERYARHCYTPDWGESSGAPSNGRYDQQVCELKGAKP